MNEGIVRLNIHGLSVESAKIQINYIITKSSKHGAYRVRIIHGCNNGTQLRDMIRKNYPKAHPKVIRVATTSNPGETDLILREF